LGPSISNDEVDAMYAEAMRLGAYDYQTKPLNLGKLEAVIQRGISFQQLVYEQHHLKRRLDEHYGLASLIGGSRAMTRIYNTVRQSASVLAPVIITGEAGAGRDLVAQAIHNTSLRRDGAFVKLDCGAGTPESIETELFGAAGSLGGRLELADEGTLYLEHIDALPAHMLEALSSLVETGQVNRPTDKKTLSVAPRLIVSWISTKKRSKVLENFLTILADSSQAIAIELPPLRKRKEDIPELVDYFLAGIGVQRETPGLRLTRNVMELFQRYEWPGNVAELRSCLEGMAVGARAGESLTLNDVPLTIREDAPHVEGDIRIPGGATMRDIERIAITETMRACDGKKEECARRLGIGLRTLYRKLKDYEESGLS